MGKMPGPRVSPERGHTFCASLRRRNALGHVTRATLDGNLEGKCQGPDTLLGKFVRPLKPSSNPVLKTASFCGRGGQHGTAPAG